MGNRLHVATKHVVEWSVNDYFNWKILEIHGLLDALGVYYTGEIFDEDFEVSREDWKKGIDTLKNFNNLSEEEQEEIQEALDRLEYSLEEVIEIFEDYYEESDKDDVYMFFAFF